MAIINGTPASETLLGTSGADTIKGLGGNDTITGGQGNDLAQMGAGNDLFIWRAGDGDDRLRGQDGFDTLVFEASNSADSIKISSDVSRVLVSEFLGNTLDLDDVERIWVRALAGADGIFIDDLAETDVQQVVVDLAGVPGGKSGDGEVDGVVRNGGDGTDILNVALVSGTVSITGPSAQVMIRNPDANDILELNGLEGNDTINASLLPAGVLRLSVYGGAGNDIIIGSAGNDLLQGDDGNDVVAGGRGNDFVDLGAGNDVYYWSIGGGRDTVIGGGGIDTLVMTGSSGVEYFDVEASSVFSSLNADDGVERIRVRALAGGDTIFMGSLAGTDVSAVDVDLAGTVSGTLPDAASDTIIIDSYTAGDDLVEVTWSGSKIVLTGLTANLSIAHSGANDLLLFSGNLGNDLYDASSLPAGKISLRFEIDGVDTIIGSAGKDTVLCFPGGEALVFLGDGNDSFSGSAGDDVAHMGAGNDFLSAGSGNDVGFLGAGNDAMDGGAGDDRAYLHAGNDRYIWTTGGGYDTVNGGTGFDTLQLNGSVANETVLVAAVGGGAHLTLNAGAGTVDLDEFEQIRIRTFGGTDSISVEHLAGAGIKQVAIDLSGAVAGAPDGVADNVGAEGSAGNDLITVTASKGVVSIAGLATPVTVTNYDANDDLAISGNDGDDTISAALFPSNALQLFIYGGIGSDTITGSAGRDVVDGGPGANLLRGGGGSDQLMGGEDNDRLDGGAGADNLIGLAGHDVILGGLGDDSIQGDKGNDTITGGAGNDRIFYSSVLDGHDVILDFDGNPTGGQDTLHLEYLFQALGVPVQDRVGRVFISNKGATVDVAVDADGNAGNGYELVVATLHTVDEIKLGTDVIIS